MLDNNQNNSQLLREIVTMGNAIATLTSEVKSVSDRLADRHASAQKFEERSEREWAAVRQEAIVTKESVSARLSTVEGRLTLVEYQLKAAQTSRTFMVSCAVASAGAVAFSLWEAFFKTIVH